MGGKKEYLDVVLVPAGLLLMFGYHSFLLYRCAKLPKLTVIGYENHCKNIWVKRMMQVDTKDRGPAVSVISGNISAATFLATTSLALTSLIGAWVGSSSNNVFMTRLVYGDTRLELISVKYISLLTCFLVAFASFLQSARNFVHTNLLITMPNTEVPVDYVQKAVIRGATFWTVGLRSLYFALTLLLWMFGPIPMFLSSIIMALILHFLDMDSTPWNEFQPASSHNPFRKIGEEISAVTWNIEHHERSHGNGSHSTGAQQ